MIYRAWMAWERLATRAFENLIGWLCLRFEQSEYFDD